jgi:hypothetical protein
MADTPSTGNTTPAVDQAPPTDTTTAQRTGETVQLAAAVVVVEVSPPARGEDVSLTVEPGQTIELKAPVIRFTQDGADLVIHWGNLGETHTTLVDALAAGTPLILADGTSLSFEQVIAQIEGFDPGAIEVEVAAIAPAAGPVVGRAAGGAFNEPFDNGTLGPEAGVTNLLLNTELQFGLLEFREELPGEVAAAGNAPPLADDVLTPADRGELPAALSSALSQLFGGVVIDFESLAHSGTEIGIGDQYNEDGFEFNNILIAQEFFAIGSGSFRNFGSTSLLNNLINGITELTREGGGTFELISIDLNQLNSSGSVVNITFTGNLAGGGTVMQTFMVNDGDIASGQTFNFNSGFTNLDSVTWVQVSPFHSFDNIVMGGGGGVPDITFFKQFTVDGIIGDSDLVLADFGGADDQTSLADLVFTLTSDPNYGFLIKVTSGDDVSVLNVAETFTSTDTIWWVATEADVSEFEVLPDATFTYSVTDADGQSASATVVVAAGLTLTGTTDGEILVGGTGPDDLFGGGGDDTLTGGAGADTFHYESIGDGDDTILDFVIADDTVDLDALFDDLGGDFTSGTDAENALARAEDVNIVGNVLTIDGVADFSITFAGTSDVFADQDGFAAAELAALGIDVGS